MEPLRDDVTVVPTGGLGKVATFVSLLGANDLQIVVLHDYEKNSAQNLADLIKLKIIEQKRVRTFSEYRPKAVGDPDGRPTDIEDLFPVEMYLEGLNAAYTSTLKKPIVESKLPPGDRIVDRVNRYLTASKETVRLAGGFNHYRPKNSLDLPPEISTRPNRSLLVI